MSPAMASAMCVACWFLGNVDSMPSARPLSDGCQPPNRLPRSTACFLGRPRFMFTAQGRRTRARSQSERPFRSTQYVYLSKDGSFEAERSRREWLAALKAAVARVSLLIGVSGAVPKDAAARTTQEPVVEALVQLPDEESDWTRASFVNLILDDRLLGDAAQTAGAKMLILARRAESEKPVLGATVAMDKIRFPVRMQVTGSNFTANDEERFNLRYHLFPTNAIGGARWPGDFEERSTYAVQVTVCGGKEAKGVVCESPSLTGSGESIFVTQLEDVPEVAESGGVRVAATVVLSPKGDFP